MKELYCTVHKQNGRICLFDVNYNHCNIIERDYMKSIYTKTVEKFGVPNQIMIAVEELAELQKELIKYLRYGNNHDKIAEEIADVKIMIEQMERTLTLKDTVNHHKKRKLERLTKMVKQ